MTDTAIAPPAEVHGKEAHHPTDISYVYVAVALAVMTGAEVVWSYTKFKGLLLALPLLIVMAAKFVVVASQFMHLRFDKKLLSRIFYAGLLLAGLVYLAALSTMDIWHGH